MNGVGTYPIIGTTRPGAITGWGSFEAAGGTTGALASTSFKGSLKGRFGVSYAATGVYTVTLGSGLSFPETPVIILSSQCADTTNTNRFQVIQTGEWNNSTRVFVIQCNQEASTFAPPATAGNRINFWIGIINSTGL